MEKAKTDNNSKDHQGKMVWQQNKRFQGTRNFQNNKGIFFKILEGQEVRTKPSNAENVTAVCTKIEQNEMQNGVAKRKKRCDLKNKIQ